MATRQFKPVLLIVFRSLLALAVAVVLIVLIQRSISQLGEQGFRFSEIKLAYWLTAIASYGGTMLFSGMFWFRILEAFDQRPRLSDALAAFFASQLGKYVPGKAMVVVIRTDMIRGEGVQVVPAAASVFVETLTWIFVGSAIACLLIAMQFRDQVALMSSAIALTLLAGVFTWPSVFRWIAGKVVTRKSNSAARFLQGLNLNLMLRGWCLLTLGWCLNGFSMWLVLKGIPGAELVWADFPLTLACVSLATVAGFVSLLPGGLGVREVVMIPLLGPRFGVGTAVVAAIAVRLVWLATEMAGAGIIYLLAKRTKK